MQKQALNKIFLTNAIYGLAGSFIGVFIPIYLLKIGFSVADIFRFYLVYAAGTFIFFFLAEKIAQKIGLRKTILLGYPLLLLYFLLIYNIKELAISIYVVAIVDALQTALYWFPLHVWLTNLSSDENRGSELGKFFALSKSICILAPLISSLVVIYLGFKALFIFSGIIYFISTFPILSMPEFPNGAKLRVGNFFGLFKKYRAFAVTDILEASRGIAEGVIWPIFVFLSFNNILSVGYIGTISGIGGVLFTLLIGKHADKAEKKKVMWIGAAILTTIWIIRFFTNSEILFYALTLCVGFFEITILLPLNKFAYEIAKKEGASDFIIFRELILAIGRIAMYGIALLFVSHLKSIFLAAALAGACLVLVSYKLEAKG